MTCLPIDLKNGRLPMKLLLSSDLPPAKSNKTSMETYEKWYSALVLLLKLKKTHESYSKSLIKFDKC